MEIQVLGLNHRIAPVELREKVSFSPAKLETALVSLRALEPILEDVILSTCNRVEIYAVSRDSRAGTDTLKRFLCDFHKVNEPDFGRYLYRYNSRMAVEHLFKVTSSLDSMVLGETQIFGQVKDAYQSARRAGCIGRIFTEVFEEALRVGKMVRSQTQIGKGAVSVGSAGIELAKKIFETLDGKSVLIIGAGKISELVVRNLISRGANMVLVSNRTFERAQELSRQFCGQAVRFESVFERMKDVDIVISSTSAPHAIIEKTQVSRVMKLRRHKPLFFIDLAVPRDIEQAVGDIDNVYLYNIDDLARVKDANIKERLFEAKKAERIVEERVEAVVNNLAGLSDSAPGALHAKH